LAESQPKPAESIQKPAESPLHLLLRFFEKNIERFDQIYRNLFPFNSYIEGEVMYEMETRKVLSSLCYFSIFFAGFIFPLVVYFASGDQGTKAHAKKSLFSHLIPLILMPFVVIAVLNDSVNIQNEIPTFTIISIVAFALTGIAVTIWNIVKGVKVLLAE
jgi:surface polysaccharide O-acyltransferase-like enzyme